MSDDRSPTPDQAERDAYFPSPYSLSQYTSPRTDFGGVDDHGDRGRGRRVLVIGTQQRYMPMRNGTFFSTGNHPVETLLPLHHLLAAGFEVDVATESGAPVAMEWWAYPGEDEAVQQTWDRLGDDFRSPLDLAHVVRDGLSPEHVAVFVPGGHGAMLGLPDSESVGAVLRDALARDLTIISLCHGPAAFLAASIGQDASPFAGYTTCAFPDALDFGPNLDIGYLPGPMPWALGEALVGAGMVLANEEMTGATHHDRQLVTGDSPVAADALGRLATRVLVERLDHAGR